MAKFAIHPVVTGKPVFLPLVSSPVAAGFPSPADDYLEQTLDLATRLVKNPRPPSWSGQAASA